MGQRLKRTKLDVQKERLKQVLKDLLQTNIDLMAFHKTLTNDTNALKTINKSIKMANRAMEIVSQVKHIEILQSLYNTFLSGKENFFVLISATISNKNKVSYWDNSEKGFEEFRKLENEAMAKTKAEYEERKKNQEIIEKAKRENKKIEFALENGKIKPIIVGDMAN